MRALVLNLNDVSVPFKACCARMLLDLITLGPAGVCEDEEEAREEVVEVYLRALVMGVVRAIVQT